MKVEVLDEDGLLERLKAASNTRWEGVVLKTLTEMFNRGVDMTPVDSGELRQSRGVVPPSNSFEGEFGYRKEYAPHVEYGHRTQGGGYVPGQRFLKANADIQRPIFQRDMKEQIKKVI